MTVKKHIQKMMINSQKEEVTIQDNTNNSHYQKYESLWNCTLGSHQLLTPVQHFLYSSDNTNIGCPLHDKEIQLTCGLWLSECC